MEKKEKPSVFDYTDYRRFLENYYAWKKELDKSFTYRKFMGRVGCNSPGFYRDLVAGRRDLSGQFILQFAKALDLRKKEAEYFEDLVRFTQAPDSEAKEYYYERMARAMNLKMYRMRVDQYAYYSRWYISAVRELLFIYDFVKDYRELACRLNPPIKAEQAKEAVDLLVRLNMIKRNEMGHYKPVEPLITTGAEVNPDTLRLYVRNFHRAMIQRASDSLAVQDSGVRDVSGVTVSIDKETFEKIKSECVSFRKLVLNWAGRQKKPDRVYQLNIQFFPLSELPQGGGKTG